jgi:assimilatory nitrate reductase catalytic subunit
MFQAWRSPAATFEILKTLSQGQPCDFSGVRDYRHIDEAGGIQWPYTISDAKAAKTGDGSAKLENQPASTPGPISQRLSANSARRASPPREQRLFADGQFFTSDRRACFVFDPPRPMPELPDAEYPFLLLTGRGSSAQWHTGSRTDKSAVLRKLAPLVLTMEMHPDDAERLNITAGGTVRIRSRRGAVEAIAILTSTVQPGQIFLPMHFPVVNQLTFPAFDPHSRQPSYKACAVTVGPA